MFSKQIPEVYFCGLQGHEAAQRNKQQISALNYLVGLVVKASSRAEDPGFESPLATGFFQVESYQ